MSTGSARPTMHPDRMRWVDYWVGIPLCALLTLVSRVLGPRRPSGSAAPRNVLFIELAEMGSTVLACPAVHRLRSRYPDCAVFFLVFTQIDEGVCVLNLTPDDHVLTIDASNAWTIARDTWRFMRKARRLRIDTAISLEMFARFSTMLTYLSGAPTRVGFHGYTQAGLYAGDLLTHRVAYNPHIHTWQSLVALVDALEEPATHVPMGKVPAAGPEACVLPALVTDATTAERIRDRLTREQPAVSGKRLVVVNPNASKLISIRKWPLERYAELVERLLRDPRNACIITGVASEQDDARFIVERVKSDRVVDLAGKTSLRDVIDLFNVADLLITNDSGPAQFAALTSIDVLVFFGPETPELYRPLTERCTVLYSHYACSPCVSAFNQRRTPCTDNQCLTTIQVEAVHAAATRILETRHGADARVLR